jgi:hypothetical protein
VHSNKLWFFSTTVLPCLNERDSIVCRTCQASRKLSVKAKGKAMFDVVIKWQLLLKYRSSAAAACKDILIVY